MEALFVVPTMVSPNVNPRLVPALAKMVERNILLINSATFRAAVLKKYSGLFKTARSESMNIVSEAGPKPSVPITTKEKRQAAGDLYKIATGMVTKPDEDPTARSTFTEPEKIEIPKGIQFFTTIGLEPTILEIPISIKATILGGTGTRVIRIGVKCVPYTVKGVGDIISMMKDLRNKKFVKRSFLSKMGLIKRKILSTSSLKQDPTDILLAPTGEELADPRFVKNMMSTGKSSVWSVLTMLSTYDFKEGDLRSSLSDYKELVKRGWGDMIVVNEPNESVHFCMMKINACYEIGFSYLKQLLNLSNVLDYSEVSRWSRPLHISTVGKALRDSVEMDDTIDELHARILEIING